MTKDENAEMLLERDNAEVKYVYVCSRYTDNCTYERRASETLSVQ